MVSHEVSENSNSMIRTWKWKGIGLSKMLYFIIPRKESTGKRSDGRSHIEIGLNLTLMGPAEVIQDKPVLEQSFEIRKGIW